ncbi:HPr family phosphocarrier protein [Hufsiella ginkgonis]|uniref:HPr family phosphocarrier protein n=1 Tax=Hufsiella ginkgonis TaxID=2695274 RepID=A0A7K1XZK1_9SPHI|nr:HPr family phosphocarrier protein [Hufsiella ginkgonis]MXV16445.1 HPr family phosphocarrier protein [Hufsiella ginkgonis]
MITKEYRILAANGLHARPATSLIRLARQFKSAIHVTKNEKRIPLQSMIGLLSLAIKHGDILLVHIDGEDKLFAATQLDKFFNEDLQNL